MAGEERDNREIREETQDALQAAYVRLPPDHPWGYFHYLDAPPAVGGGVGCFAWFESRDALLTFIARYQAWMGAPETGAAPAQKAEHMRLVIAQVQADKIGMEQARLEINELLRTYSQIDWWGHADQLLAGDSDFARELREWYRDFSQLGPVDALPIAEAEAWEFFYALQVYGM